MAQVKYSGNLSAASFPFASVMKGPSVIVPNRDQNSGPYRDFSGATTQLGMNIAQIYYLENVVPTNEGYKSVAFNPFIGPAVGYTGVFLNQYTVFDGRSNKAIIGVTSTFEIWILSAYTGGGWQKVTGIPWTSGILTYGQVFGTVYVNLQGLGIYIYDIPTNAWTKATVTGIVDTNLIGIVDSTSYLIGYTADFIAWSSTEDPLDFVPSTITGAGGGTPESLKGQIIYCKEITKGYIIYSSVMILAALYSGNTQYPWVFIPLANGSGIGSPDDVIDDIDVSSQWAWTAAGLLEVTTQYCTAKFPEATDFLAAGIWEEFDNESKQVITDYTTVPYVTRLAAVGSRYFCISYGKNNGPNSPMTYSLIYDGMLKRWGKLKTTHAQMFEIVSDTSGLGLTWAASAPKEWDDYPVAWASLVSFSNTPAKAKKTMGALAPDGSISYVDFTYASNGAAGLAIFGKFQLTRTSLCTLEETEVETVDEATNNFSLTVQSTDNGRTVNVPVTTPYQYSADTGYRRYDCRVTGVNHSIIIQGSFNLNSYQLTLHQNGRR